jgi:hypothetical protein
VIFIVKIFAILVVTSYHFEQGTFQAIAIYGRCVCGWAGVGAEMAGRLSYFATKIFCLYIFILLYLFCQFRTTRV